MATRKRKTLPPGTYTGTTAGGTAVPTSFPTNTGAQWAYNALFTPSGDWSASNFTLGSGSATTSASPALLVWARSGYNRSPGPDYYVQATVTAPTTNGNTFGVLGRYTFDGVNDNYYLLRIKRQATNDDVELCKCVAGTISVLTSGTFTISGHWSAGDYLRLEMAGNVLAARKSSDGTTWTDLGNVTDSTYQEVCGSYGLQASGNQGSAASFKVDYLDSTDNLVWVTTGAVGPTTARIAFAVSPLLSGANTVTVEYSTDSGFASTAGSGSTTVDLTTDYCGKVDLTGLTAATRYYCRVKINGVVKSLSPFPTFATFPAAGSSASFSFVFGSCHSVVSTTAGAVDDTAFASVVNEAPAFALHLGDLAYQDVDGTASLPCVADLRNKHGVALRSGSRTKNWQAARRKLPWFTMWDDHDTGVDNFSAASNQAYYLPARQAFVETGGQGNPDPYDPTHASSFYYAFAYGNVGFFVPDLRSYRSSNAATDDGSKTILGATQLANLKAWLTANKFAYRLKFICCSVAVSGFGNTSADSWGGDKDTFQVPTGANGFRTERNALWDWITTNNIPGVVWLEADQHWSQSATVTRSGFPHYCWMASAFNCTPLSPLATTDAQVNWNYNAKRAYGVVAVNTTVSPATAVYTLKDLDGNTVTGTHPAGSPATTAATTSVTTDDLNAGLTLSRRRRVLTCGGD